MTKLAEDQDCDDRPNRPPLGPRDPCPPTWLWSDHDFFRRAVGIRGQDTGVPAVSSVNGGSL
jgi:hypothetical protein